MKLKYNKLLPIIKSIGLVFYYPGILSVILKAMDEKPWPFLVGYFIREIIKYGRGGCGVVAGV